MKKIAVSALIAASGAMYLVRRVIASKQAEQADTQATSKQKPTQESFDNSGGGIMGDIENKAEELKGAAKEHIGDATDNEDMQAEGTAEKAKANAKQAGENVKDAVKDTFDR